MCYWKIECRSHELWPFEFTHDKLFNDFFLLISDNCIIKKNLNYFILKGIKCSVNEPFYILKLYALNSENKLWGYFSQ